MYDPFGGDCYGTAVFPGKRCVIPRSRNVTVRMPWQLLDPQGRTPPCDAAQIAQVMKGVVETGEGRTPRPEDSSSKTSTSLASALNHPGASALAEAALRASRWSFVPGIGVAGTASRFSAPRRPLRESEPGDVAGIKRLVRTDCRQVLSLPPD